MTGFVVVAAVLLARDDALFTSAAKAVLTFAALWVVLGFVQDVLSAVAGSVTSNGPVDTEQH